MTDAKPVEHTGEELHRYWTKDAEGLARWRDEPKPWVALHGLLSKYMAEPMASRVASAWFREVLGRWPSKDDKSAKRTRKRRTPVREAILAVIDWEVSGRRQATRRAVLRAVEAEARHTQTGPSATSAPGPVIGK